MSRRIKPASKPSLCYNTSFGTMIAKKFTMAEQFFTITAQISHCQQDSCEKWQMITRRLLQDNHSRPVGRQDKTLVSAIKYSQCIWIMEDYFASLVPATLFYCHASPQKGGPGKKSGLIDSRGQNEVSCPSIPRIVHFQEVLQKDRHQALKMQEVWSAVVVAVKGGLVRRRI